MLSPIFRPPHKKKIFRRNQKNNSSEKKIPDHLENGQKLVEDVQKCKDWNLTVYR